MNILKKIQYNTPVILTYALLSLIVLVIGQITGGRSDELLFMVRPAPLTDPLTYVRMVGHVLGHSNPSHYLNNFLLILLIGPILEEKYGSALMLIMIAITSVITGVIFLLVSRDAGLYGASGIVFMLIMLSSFVNLKQGRIPLTLILVIVVYIGREVYQGFTAVEGSNISHLTHVIGGMCGAVLGYFINVRRMGKEKKEMTVSESEVI